VPTSRRVRFDDAGTQLTQQRTANPPSPAEAAKRDILPAGLLLIRQRAPRLAYGTHWRGWEDRRKGPFEKDGVARPQQTTVSERQTGTGTCCCVVPCRSSLLKAEARGGKKEQTKKKRYQNRQRRSLEPRTGLSNLFRLTPLPTALSLASLFFFLFFFLACCPSFFRSCALSPRFLGPFLFLIVIAPPIVSDVQTAVRSFVRYCPFGACLLALPCLSSGTHSLSPDVQPSCIERRARTERLLSDEKTNCRDRHFGERQTQIILWPLNGSTLATTATTIANSRPSGFFSPFQFTCRAAAQGKRRYTGKERFLLHLPFFFFSLFFSLLLSPLYSSTSSSSSTSKNDWLARTPRSSAQLASFQGDEPAAEPTLFYSKPSLSLYHSLPSMTTALPG
jgi:hypothetical protein